MDQKLEQLCEVFETSNLTPETELETLQWDSMAMLSVIAIAKQKGVKVTAAQLRSMETIADVLSVI